jgi:hypothetical protein
MDSDLMQVMHSLKVLGTLRENDRITTKQGIHVQKCTNVMSGILRWFSSETRLTNILALKKLFESALKWCQTLSTERKTILDEETNVLDEKEIKLLKNSQQMERLEAAIKQGLAGMVNLCVTYADDSHCCTLLVLINDNTIDELSRYKKAYELSVKRLNIQQ